MSSLLFVFRNKLTGEYLDSNYNYTEDISKAIGCRSYKEALDDINNFDEPEEYYVVRKVTNITILGEPIEVTQYI
jgi:hypothetical protein